MHQTSDMSPLHPAMDDRTQIKVRQSSGQVHSFRSLLTIFMSQIETSLQNETHGRSPAKYTVYAVILFHSSTPGTRSTQIETPLILTRLLQVFNLLGISFWHGNCNTQITSSLTSFLPNFFQIFTPFRLRPVLDRPKITSL